MAVLEHAGIPADFVADFSTQATSDNFFCVHKPSRIRLDHKNTLVGFLFDESIGLRE
jgi:hypothetical protein